MDIAWGDADYLDMRINEPIADAYAANAVALGRVLTPHEELPAATTDMANVSHRIPVLHAVITCAPPTTMLHTTEFAAAAASPAAERAILDGAKALAMTAIDFLSDPDLRHRAAAAFMAPNGHRQETRS